MTPIAEVQRTPRSCRERCCSLDVEADLAVDELIAACSSLLLQSGAGMEVPLTKVLEQCG